jgi:hypothetical protein
MQLQLEFLCLLPYRQEEPREEHSQSCTGSTAVQERLLSCTVCTLCSCSDTSGSSCSDTTQPQECLCSLRCRRGERRGVHTQSCTDSTEERERPQSCSLCRRCSCSDTAYSSCPGKQWCRRWLCWLRFHREEQRYKVCIWCSRSGTACSSYPGM